MASVAQSAAAGPSGCAASETPRKSEGWTPGPWQWDAGVIPPDGPGRYADIYTDGGDTIIAHFNDLIPEGRANANLMVAAPDLYEALTELLSGHDNLYVALFGPSANPLNDIAAKAARAALSRARGEAQ